MLLTRSPLGHLSEERASLDLHVLSTPPAFVLSQDQTLREGMYDSWSRTNPIPECRHRKSPPCSGMIAGHTSWFKSLARCTKGIAHEINNDHVPRGITYGTNFRHAVEFSRSGRTPLQPFRPASGQPMKLYSVSFARSNRHRPHSHLVCGRGLAASSSLGVVRPAPLLAAPCAEQAEL